jgi:hypothetical protein
VKPEGGGDIKIDREGRLWHEGEEIVHEGLRAALFRWLDRQDADSPANASHRGEPRYVFRLDQNRFAHVEVEDTPLVARAVQWIDGHPILMLSDGASEPLDPRLLTVDAEGVLRAWVRNGRLEARLATSAVAGLAGALDEDARGLSLILGGVEHAVSFRPIGA